MGLMAIWAEESPLEKKLRVSRGRRFGQIEGEIETYDLPVGSIERAEILLMSTFLYKPFDSFVIWNGLMKAHGFVVKVNFETIRRNTEKLRWEAEAQVYIAERRGGGVENVFVRTVRLESTDPLKHR